MKGMKLAYLRSDAGDSFVGSLSTAIRIARASVNDTLDCRAGSFDGDRFHGERKQGRPSFAITTKCSFVMHSGVACGTKRNQVHLGIVARSAAEFLVMDFETGPRAAELASPAIAELFVQLGLEPQSRLLWSQLIHDAFSLTNCGICLIPASRQRSRSPAPRPAADSCTT
jgi:hypothetical protein